MISAEQSEEEWSNQDYVSAESNDTSDEDETKNDPLPEDRVTC